MYFNVIQFDTADYTDAAAAADARCGYTLNYAFRMKDGISLYCKVYTFTHTT